MLEDSPINRRNAIVKLASGAVGVAITTRATAAELAYPDRPITLVTPFGGPTDVIARLLAQNLAQRLGVAVIVDQKIGASGTIAMAQVARAVPDGYTLAMGTSTTLTTAQHLFANPRYDAAKSFTYLGVIQTSRMVLVVTPQLGVNSLAEFVALAKSRPNMLNFGSSGIGTTMHLAAEQYNAATGIKAVHVPYKSGPETDTALLAGNIHYVVSSLPTSLALIKAGRLKALAVTGDGRDTSIPDIISLREAGLTELIPDQFFGFIGPANMPAAVVARLTRALDETQQDAEFKETVRKGGGEPSRLGPQEFRSLATAHSKQWGELIRRLNITLQ